MLIFPAKIILFLFFISIPIFVFHQIRLFSNFDCEIFFILGTKYKALLFLLKFLEKFSDQFKKLGVIAVKKFALFKENFEAKKYGVNINLSIFLFKPFDFWRNIWGHWSFMSTQKGIFLNFNQIDRKKVVSMGG